MYQMPGYQKIIVPFDVQKTMVADVGLIFDNKDIKALYKFSGKLLI